MPRRSWTHTTKRSTHSLPKSNAIKNTTSTTLNSRTYPFMPNPMVHFWPSVSGPPWSCFLVRVWQLKNNKMHSCAAKTDSETVLQYPLNIKTRPQSRERRGQTSMFCTLHTAHDDVPTRSAKTRSWCGNATDSRQQPQLEPTVVCGSVPVAAVWLEHLNSRVGWR